MGLLSLGTPLHWPDSLKHIEYVKKHGVIQFINQYKRLRDRENDKFLFGDELEYIMFHMPKDEKKAKILLKAKDIMDRLSEKLKALVKAPDAKAPVVYLPEYGSFMIEATPGRPYGGYSSDLRLVEKNMRLRRELIESILTDDQFVLTTSNHPRLGVGEFSSPHDAPRGPIANSQYIPDIAINPHPRFGALTRNIRTRRGSNVDIRMPLFIDENTVEKKEADAGHIPDIHMDAMCFGMGCTCLQVTFQARNITEARNLYDQLVVLGPIMLALTAATPFHRGRIADTDVRWNVIAQSVDDRTPGERGLEPLKEGQQRIHKSRYDSVDSYISTGPLYKEKYNDIPLTVNDCALEQLREAGVDELLAKHVAHLFIRDPLVIFGELIELDDETSTNHFENIQSTNWQTCRFKPPPENSDIGWRVEFRSMEVQITEFENAAFTVFIALINRAILFFQLNLYVPISKVDENMKTAHLRDACRRNTFHFRSNLKQCEPESDDSYGQYTMDDIINGSDDLTGLIPIVKAYLDAIDCDALTRQTVDGYLDLISKRASGTLLTQAQWQRTFVDLHPKYKKDSHLSEEVTRDLLDAQVQITHGALKAPQLLGAYCAPQSSPHPSSPMVASTSSPGDTEAEDLPDGVKLTEEAAELDLFAGSDSVCSYLRSLLAKNLPAKSTRNGKPDEREVVGHVSSSLGSLSK